jgi:hypothetical protein|tara:strand:+ start:261 stop:458 length:198 start_codon:yes stop_codon:yes gene_type:complete
MVVVLAEMVGLALVVLVVTLVTLAVAATQHSMAAVAELVFLGWVLQGELPRVLVVAVEDLVVQMD